MALTHNLGGTTVPATVVVLRALGLGDLLTAVPALRGLRRHAPIARIVLAAPSRYRELALLTGAVDEVVDAAGPGPVSGIDAPPDLAVNLHGRGPQSIGALLQLSPAMLLTHRHDDHPGIAGPRWRADLHEVDRWCELLHWAGIDCRADDLLLDRPEGYPHTSDAVIIHPGAAAAARRWPAERFAAVARTLSEQGMRVVVSGSPAEHDLVADVTRAAGLPPSAMWCSPDLLALVALVSDARLLICGDTGVGHLATATGTPSVLLFGPTPPQQWGPRRAGDHIALWAGDRGDPHADRPDSGLLLITVARVLNAAQAALGRTA